MNKRNIAIIGAGQAGLLLAIGLVKQNYKVTLYSDKTAEQFQNGRILSSQVLFQKSLDIENSLDLNFWKEEAPQNQKVYFNLVNVENKSKAIEWVGKTKSVFTSVDQRLKFSYWINEFIKLGGIFIQEKVTEDNLLEINEKNDLTIIATGKGDLNKIFSINETETVYQTPQRKLVLFYVKNLIPNNPNGISINLLPGIGEYFCVEGLSHNDNCHMMLFEFKDHSVFDCWHKLTSNEAMLNKAKELLEEYLPWEYLRAEHAELVDDKSILQGAVTPTVKDPLACLNNGKYVLGIGDAVLLNDPIAGQGANCATKAANIYLKQILSHGNKPFNTDWMLETWDLFWAQSRWSYYWSNMLLEAPEPHMVDLLSSAAQSQDIANKIAELFNDPIDAFPMVSSEKHTREFIIQYLPKNKHYETSKNIDLYEENKKYINKFELSEIMKFIKSDSIYDSTKLDSFLSCVQSFSNHFQSMVMLRKVFNTDPNLQGFADQHLHEEFEHNLDLMKYRNNNEGVWDPILESTVTWFTWKMMQGSDIEKHVIMHMVLEASADIFFKEAHKVMQKVDGTKYFKLHAECDEGHAMLGQSFLNNLDNEVKQSLLDMLDKSWNILNIACNRMVSLSLNDTREEPVL